MDHLQRTARPELREKHLGEWGYRGSDHNRSHQARLGGRDAFKRQEVVGRRSSFLRSRLIIRDFHFGFPYRRLYTDRKSTRLNSSHLVISYAVFCYKKRVYVLWVSS